MKPTKDTDKTMDINSHTQNHSSTLISCHQPLPIPIPLKHFAIRPYNAFATPPSKQRLRLTASTGRLLDALACTYLDSWLVVGGWGPHSFLIKILALQGGNYCMRGVSHLNLSCHSQESLFNVVGALCWRLKEWDAQTVGKFLSPKLGQQQHSQRALRMNIPLLRYIPQLSYRTYHSCFQQGAYSRPLWHNGQFLVATVSHCWKNLKKSINVNPVYWEWPRPTLTRVCHIKNNANPVSTW